MNKSRQHLHCFSLVQGYSYRSRLQSTFPQERIFDRIKTESFVATLELINKYIQNTAEAYHLELGGGGGVLHRTAKKERKIPPSCSLQLKFVNFVCLHYHYKYIYYPA